MNSTFKRLTLSLILGLTLCLSSLVVLNLITVGVVYASGSIRYVAPTPFGNDSNNHCLTPANPCATVQRAVDQANSGDEIRVAGGTYQAVFSRTGLGGVVTQVVYISKSLTIRGGYTPTQWAISDPGANPTRLDAQAKGRVVNLEGALSAPPISVTLQGLWLENGNSQGQIGSVITGGGGGIQGFRVTATLRSNTIAHNIGQGAGGGILLFGEAPATLIDNVIVSNTVETTDNTALGGGVSLAINSTQNIVSTLEGNVIRGNVARVTNPAFEAKGGGLYLLANNVNRIILNNNLIQANRVETGNSQDQGGGGGLYLEGGQITMINTALVNNQIIGPGYGAGVFVFSDKVNGLHLTIAKNKGGDGSGLNARFGAITLTNTILAEHSVGIRTVTSNTFLTINNILWFANNTNDIGTGSVVLNNEYTGNPAFQADGYHLGSSSAAINRGVNAGVATDIDGESRDLAQPDLGADEAKSLSLYLPVIVRAS